MKKGQMHVLDAMAAVIILLFFAVGTFSVDSNTDWSSYENEIASHDLTKVIKDTGHLESFLKRGETGSLKTALSSVSERDLGVGGSIEGLPPNLKIAFHTMPSRIQELELKNVSSGDRCDGDLDELEKRSVTPILRTQSTIESSHGGYRIYLGNYRKFEDLASRTRYDALWIDDGDCDFSQPSDPVRLDEIFEWGPGDDVFEFRGVDLDVNSQGDIVNATLNLAEAEQMKRFQGTFDREISGIRNRIEIDSFKLEDEADEIDIFVFRKNESIERIENGRTAEAESKIGDKPVMVLADLNSSLLDEGDFLYQKGLRWVDLPYTADSDASCGLAPDGRSIDAGCNLEAGHSDHEKSREVRSNSLGLRTSLSDLSMYPSGSVTSESEGALSYSKILYVENYAYENLSRSPENLLMTSASFSSGERPYTQCGNATEGDFVFPEKDGSTETLQVVSTQLGESQDYCDRNNRAVYIDRDDDGEYSDEEEGPFLEGEKVQINGMSYNVRVPSGGPQCGTDDCVIFENQENAQIPVINYAESTDTARAAYERVYSEDDRKMLVATMYMISKGSDITSASPGQLASEITGVVNGQQYKVNLRWSN